jgi:tRNA dimethylallyltransferase
VQVMEKTAKERKILIILGPTSSGKTSLSLDLCKKFNAEIISADSRQVYKYMDIGTGKVPVGSMAAIERGEGIWKVSGVPVHGYDLIEPGEYFSAYDFFKFARAAISDIHAKGKNVIVAGGTGFYIDSLTGEKDLSGVGPDFHLRDELGAMSKEELSDMLRSVSPGEAEKVDLNNPVRMIRALEKALTLREGVESEEKRFPSTDRYDFVKIGLTAERPYLYGRADMWAEQVWNGGLPEEVESLLSKGYGDTPQLKGIVYRTAVSYVKGEVSRDEALQRCKWDLHAYIRRQQTWFKKDTSIEWFDITEDNLRKKVEDTVQFL